MTDLNLLHGTVTDGGSTSTYEWHTPEAANDGTDATRALSDAGVVGDFATVTRILKTNLGAAYLVSGMTILSETYDGNDPGWTVQHSSDGVSWSSVTSPVYGNTYLGGELNRQDITFDQVTKRYFRITTTITFGAGVHFVTDAHVWTWAITEGAPPPPPEPGTTVDFDDDGFDTDDEIKAYVGSWHIQRGASAEITGGASVGTCSVILINTDDRFNPRNASGPYYGRLRDGLPLWLGINNDGTLSGTESRGLFGGYTKDWTPIVVPGSSTGHAPTVELTGEDALSLYGRTKVQVTEDIGRSHDDLRHEMLTAGNETRVDLAPEILRLPLSSWDGDLLAGLEAINKANGTRHFCKPADDRLDWYTYTTRNRQWRLDATIDASWDAGTDHVTGVTGLTLSADTVTNEQKASATPVSFMPSSTTVWRADALPFTFSGTKEMWVEFDDYVKSPALSINYTGTAPSTSLEGFGETAKITLVSAGTTTVTGLLIQGALARRAQDDSYVADDTVSQAGTRGVRAGSDIGPQFVGSLATARGIAEHVVWRYGNPQLRPTVTVENWIPEQFDIDLYDIVAGTTSMGDLDAVLFEVVGLTHDGYLAASTSARYHVTTYVLQECRVQDAADFPWFVLDTSLLDSADVLAY